MPLRSGGTFDGFWGDGSDGNVTISAPSVQTSPKQYRTLTINAGQRLDASSYPVVVQDLLTLGAASFLHADGNPGADSPGGGGGAGGAAYPGSEYSLGGYAGSAGGGAGAAANNLQGFGSVTQPAYGGGGGGGGNGTNNGGGGAVLASNGGAHGVGLGGTGSNGANNDNNFLLSNYTAAIMHAGNLISALHGGLVLNAASGLLKPAGGFGGAGGGGGPGTFDGQGGGGGGGAGVIVVLARRIQCLSGTGGITAIGGKGGIGFTAPSTGVGGGGGGGGGGGLVIVYYGELIGAPIISAVGGAGGLGGASVGNPHGGSGGNGGAGRLVFLKF